MAINTSFLAALVALLPFALPAQDCALPYTLPLFGVHVDSSVVYGSATRYDDGTSELRMNIFKPIGDGQAERPLLVVIHGGGLFAGDMNEMNDLCHGLASSGWAAATISYRLGFYGNGLFEPPYAHDPAEVQRALYRAMQDAKGAVRFLKGRHELDSTSTTNVFLVGFSAGALTALQAAYLTDASQKPAACGAIGDVQHFLNLYPRPDLGDVDGPLHQNGYDAAVAGVVSIFGAIADTGWITLDGPALYTYHQTGDPIVGCGLQRPYWGIGLGVADNWPWYYGSCAIDVRMQHLGPAPGRYLFHPYNGNAHDLHDPAAVMLEAMGWMRNLFCNASTGVSGVEATPLRAYPNPVKDQLFIDVAPRANVPFTLMDAMGRLVRTGTLDGAPLELGRLAPGSYWLRMGQQGGVQGMRITVIP